MITCRVVPVQEFVKIIKQFSAFLVGMIPFFDFSIGLHRSSVKGFYKNNLFDISESK